ncbi:MAG TPA: hypothetical protein VGF70_15070 [Solirubrobacteraceae bacterium]|jgi:hypothetical protein
MPQARSGRSGSSSKGSSSRRSTSASKPKSTGRSSTGPRAKSKSTSSRASSSRSTAARSSSSRSTKARSSRTTKPAAGARKQATRAAGSAEARVDAVAQRLRKLNERIIEAGRDAGETTLTNYEKALKTIAGTLEKGPGSSDVEWVANLATAQAKFLRDVTTSWTAAARKVLK